MNVRMTTHIPSKLWINNHEQNIPNNKENKYEFQSFSAHNKLQENDKFLPLQIGATNLEVYFRWVLHLGIRYQYVCHRTHSLKLNDYNLYTFPSRLSALSGNTPATVYYCIKPVFKHEWYFVIHFGQKKFLFTQLEWWTNRKISWNEEFHFGDSLPAFRSRLRKKFRSWSRLGKNWCRSRLGNIRSRLI